jgi:membrane protease YdiL (CAAX protease family)
VSLLTTLVGLALAFAGFDAVARLTDRLEVDHWAVDHLSKWLVAALVVAYVLLVEGAPLSSIGVVWDGPVRFGFETLVGLAVMLGANVLTQPLWARLEDGGDEAVAEGLGSFAERSMGGRLFVAATAGVTEEVPYRGYAIERLATLTGSPLVAGGLSAVAFVAAHYGEVWDRAALLRIAQPALVVTAVYLWTRSLPVVVAVHALNDAVGLALADRYAPDDDDGPPSES